VHDRGIYPCCRHKREESRFNSPRHASDPLSFWVVVALVARILPSVCSKSAHRTVARVLFEVRLLILEWHLPSVILKVCLLLDELLFLSNDELRSHFSLLEVQILVLRSSKYTLNR